MYTSTDGAVMKNIGNRRQSQHSSEGFYESVHVRRHKSVDPPITMAKQRQVVAEEIIAAEEGVEMALTMTTKAGSRVSEVRSHSERNKGLSARYKSTISDHHSCVLIRTVEKCAVPVGG